MNRFVCIHGHFYQPPRENPWLEDVELQDSAAPFHDWNDRVCAECYEPNRAARILDGQGLISRIVNNYSRISFNFGPTLLSWMERHRPQTYQAILDADRLSRKRFSGHGSALAQAYNHLIMPLANGRDKRTQIRWGVRDFVHRFGRPPEGMWLPETAVDVKTLEELAAAEIAFTILAPHQASRLRRLGEQRWRPAEEGLLDPRLPYRCNLPSGRHIHLFFYDGPISQDVAFGGLLNDGDKFARRLLGVFTRKERPELVHIATDGESYGHHHRFGEMALAYCLQEIEKREQARLTIYGEFLEQHAAEHEVEIREETSWSCHHGIERWRSDCGCHIGSHPGWNQSWRKPLRQALDWLRDRLATYYEATAAPLLTDPWQARDDYIEVVLDRAEERVKTFLRRQGGRDLSAAEAVQALQLLEMQRHAMLMYTSCGWFFDEISGIETTQILGYAGRALQLARESGGPDLEVEFRHRLEKAPSNRGSDENGATIYDKTVRDTRLDLIRVAAHHAIVTGFEGNHRSQRLFCYRAENLQYEQIHAGRLLLSIGRNRIRSETTWEEGDFCFAVLHLGGHNLNAGVGADGGALDFERIRQELRGAFEKSDIAEVYRLLDHHFGSHNYTLWHLFRDEQRKVLNQVMNETLADIETAFRKIYEDHFTLLRFLQEVGMPPPPALAFPVEAVFTSQLRQLLDAPEFAPQQVRNLAGEAARLGIRPNQALLVPAATDRIDQVMEQLRQSPRDTSRLQAAEEAIAALLSLDLKLDLRQAQNSFVELRETVWSSRPAAAGDKDKQAKDRQRHLAALAGHLKVALD